MGAAERMRMALAIPNTFPFKLDARLTQESKEEIKEEPESYIVPDETKKEITRSLARMCAIDCIAFNTVNHQGFRGFIDLIMQLSFNWGRESVIKGHLYKPPTVDQVLPSHVTIARSVINQVDSLKGPFDAYILSNLMENGGAFSMDCTSKNFRYAGVAVHFIDNDWVYRNFLLDIHNLWGKDARSIRNDFNSTLNRHNLSENILKNVWIVTDEEAAMKAAFADCHRIDCNCHLCNTTAKRIVQPYKSPKFTLVMQLENYVSSEIETVDTTMKNAIHVINAVKFVIFFN
uniref:Transposase n=1 Tax=Acrobeloides nanus TaxID=290746 RepID=A0A914DAS5_9BILA